MSENLKTEQNLISDDESIIELKVNKDDIKDVEPKKPRAKRIVSEKTKEALAKGREKLQEKWKNDKVKNDELKKCT